MDLVFLLVIISAAQPQIIAALLTVVSVMKLVSELVIVAEMSMSSTACATEVGVCSCLCNYSMGKD